MMIHIALALFLIDSIDAAQLRWQSSEQQQPIKVSLLPSADDPSYEDLGATNSGTRVSVEQVDRLTNPSGDYFWREPLATPQAWINRIPVESNVNNIGPLYSTVPIHKRRFVDYESNSLRDNQGHDYDALLNEFKHWSHLSSNPMRENRAFKPKLMSTARGFGKRSIGLAPSDAADYDSNTGLNGKMSGSAIR